MSEAWVYGLKQDGLTRSNLAFGTAELRRSPAQAVRLLSPLSLDFFNGDTGLKGQPHGHSVGLSRSGLDAS